MSWNNNNYNNMSCNNSDNIKDNAHAMPEVRENRVSSVGNTR